jgi:hypothetical protein
MPMAPRLTSRARAGSYVKFRVSLIADVTLRRDYVLDRASACCTARLADATVGQ